MANELRLPLLRLIDGTGGGGSVKTLDAKNARTYVPMNPGWDRKSPIWGRECRLRHHE